jgi:hypothetical protein
MTKAAMPHTLDPRTPFERAFEALGFDTQLVDAVIGDLTEEFDTRVEQKGALRARLWYVGELLRSAPFLFAAAARRGSPRARLLLALAVSVGLLAFTATTAFVLTRDGPPAKLVSNLSDAGDNVLLNNTSAVKLPVRVLDRKGHALDPHRVRYTWIAGMTMDVSSDGVLQCKQRGDAVIRATLGDLTKNLAIRCRPVGEIRIPSWLDLIAGGAARELTFEGVGTDHEPVEQLRGVLRVGDSTVATLDGLNIRPVTVGQTAVNLVAGDKKAGIRIIVNELVASFEHLRGDQHFVARQVHLAQGDTVSWPLPRGNFWLKYVPARPDEAPPTISLHGAACGLAGPLETIVVTQDEFATLCTVVGPASVQLADGKRGSPFVEGFIVLDIRQ